MVQGTDNSKGFFFLIFFYKNAYTVNSETNHVPREYSVSAILSLLFMLPILLVPMLALLYFYVSTFRSMCALLNMAVFCSSFTSRFPGMLFMYFCLHISYIFL